MSNHSVIQSSHQVQQARQELELANRHFSEAIDDFRAVLDVRAERFMRSFEKLKGPAQYIRRKPASVAAGAVISGLIIGILAVRRRKVSGVLSTDTRVA